MPRTASLRLSFIALFLAVALVAPAGLATHVISWTPPPPEFPEVSAERIVMPIMKWDPSLGPAASLLDLLPSGSPAAADFDRSGRVDIFVPSSRYTDDAINDARAPQSRLYMNNRGFNSYGEDKFVEVTDISGVDVQGYAYAASWADFNNDGWEDLFVGGYHLAKLYRNTGDSRFTDVSASAGLPQDGLVLGGAWGDYDADGFVDLFLAGFSTYTHPDDGLPSPDFSDVAGKSNVLLRNKGDGTFEDVSGMAGINAVARRSTSAAFVDADDDGRSDIYVTNYGQASELWRNNGDGTFTEKALALGLADGEDATCQAWEDFDRDGRVDVYVAHQAGIPDSLFQQQPDGTFAEAAGSVGLGVTSVGRAWGCVAFDYDNDGDFDVFVAQSDVQGAMAQKPHLLTNLLDEGAGLLFRDDTDEAGDHDAPNYATRDTLTTARAASGAAVIEWDDDGEGAVDLVTTNNDRDFLRMYKDVGWDTGWVGANGNYLKIRLEGVSSNRDGIGAKVTVTAGILSYTRTAGAAMSWGGQSRTDLHFGLWNNTEAHYKGIAKPVNITVEWPSGIVDSYTNLLAAGAAYIMLVEGGTWRRDSCAPATVLTLKSGTLGQNGWHTSPSVTYELRGVDRLCGNSAPIGIKSLRYSLDATLWTSVAVPLGSVFTPGVTLPAFSGDGSHRLWIETIDKADNKAVFQFPIRVDTVAPTGALVSPAPGSLYVQGREVAGVGDPAGLNRAVVVAPAPIQFAGMDPAADGMLNALAGSDGAQPVIAEASDAGSGVASVTFAFTRSTGQPMGTEVTVAAHQAPYAYDWLVGTLPAGEYKVYTTITDRAGLERVLVNKVVLVPTLADGLKATLPVVGQGPAVPTLS